MILTLLLAGVLASLAFALAAYLAERGLAALGRATRLPWVVALLAPVSVPAGQLLAMALEAPAPIVTENVAQTLPLTTILTAGVVQRFSATTWANVEYWLLTLWLGVSLVILFRLAFSSRALARIGHTWTRGEVAGVSVWISETYGPAVVGLRRPEIVVPRRTADLPLEEQRLAVEHELEHIAARDQWLVRISALAVALVPWNPLLWFAARRLRSAIEIDCDARVLQKGPNVRAYASLVLNVASWPRESPAGALALGEGAIAELERRLRLMTTNPSPRRLTPAVLAFAGALALAVYGCEVAVNVEQPNRLDVPVPRSALDQQDTDAQVSENEVHKLPVIVTTAVTTPASGRAFWVSLYRF